MDMRTLYLALFAAMFGCRGTPPSTDEADPSAPLPPAPVQQPASLAGTLTGLAPGQSVVLETALGQELRLAQNGPFELARGVSHDLRVKTNPEGQSCRVREAAVSCRSVEVW
jgi:hypothetical protein